MRTIALSLLFNVYWVIAVLGRENYWYLLVALLVASVYLDKRLLWVVPVLLWSGSAATPL
ncbi:hypothetical protein [Veronia nyctiphanis]|uniref:hypothetical protein n=1 Tax=Veronia nyctiphanis TaxID=1278244 RepID=UPI0013761C6F|nr:hypothetical protein [Veronia nyctiphanis]